jgi:hypothetical protein
MDRLALTIDQAVKAGGPRRAKLYDEIRRGRLRAVKIGRSTRILVSYYKEYLASLPSIEPLARRLRSLRQREKRPREKPSKPRS